MKKITRQDTSQAFADLMPKMIRGTQLDFFLRKGVTQTQFLVLMAIHGYGRCSMSVLSKNMHVSMPTMTGIVQRLVESGHLRRVKETEDRRQVIVELTSKGEGFIVEFKSLMRSRWEEVLKVLGQGELETFHNVIVKINESLWDKS